MLDAQLHYPVFTYEFRSQARTTSVAKRGVRRIFRLGESRTTRHQRRSR
ncbi:MAG TPA: hypothetical protein VF153_03980 [Candidatus Limnocylindria bacterium]